MYTATLENGTLISGRPWHEMPVDVRVVSLGASVRVMGPKGMQTVADDVYAGFDAYGFQRYDVVSVGGRGQGYGLQLLCVTGDAFLTVDLNLATGQRRCTLQPLAAMTYDRRLLRTGAPKVLR